MADIVIREVTKDVWTFSKPFLRFSIIPVGGRSTAIKLTTGDVWVLASTPLGTQTKDKLNELGPVKYIVCGDAEHTIYLREFKTAYPEAKLIGIEPIVDKTSLKDLKFDGVYGKDSKGTKYGFEDEIKSCYFSGFKNKDVAFLHTRSKTLVEADLLFNLPAKEQFSKSTTSSWFPFVNSMKPYTAFHRSMVRSLVQDKAAMQRDAKTVSEWDFDRIIPCHGDVVETGGNKAWRDVYADFLA